MDFGLVRKILLLLAAVSTLSPAPTSATFLKFIHQDILNSSWVPTKVVRNLRYPNKL